MTLGLYSAQIEALMADGPTDDTPQDWRAFYTGWTGDRSRQGRDTAHATAEYLALHESVQKPYSISEFQDIIAENHYGVFDSEPEFAEHWANTTFNCDAVERMSPHMNWDSLANDLLSGEFWISEETTYPTGVHVFRTSA